MSLERSWFLLAPCGPLYAQVSMSFEGCPSFGQTEKRDAPKGTSRSVSISPKDSGSSGATLYLSPKPIRFTESGWDGLEGSAIELSRTTSEASGRYEVAEIMARVFPTYRESARRVLSQIDGPIPSGPWPNDTLKYIGKTIVEYTTPAQRTGLGNFDSYLSKSDTPILGAAILIMDPTKTIGFPPNVLLLSVRLPADLAWLAPVLISYVERTAAPHN